jgi:glycerol-3-phosphate acyltransferase PlsY
VSSLVFAVAIVPAAFAVGAIPFGVILAGRHGVDIRTRGSGNIGATNVARVLGARAGLIVLLLDSTKGAIPTWLALAHAPCRWVVAAAGLAAILGHCFSPFLGWRGGKGVATALGVFAVLAPPVALAGIAAFVVVFAIVRVPAVGSLAGSTVMAAIFAARGPAPDAVLAIVTTALLVYTHRGNLAKLRSGTRSAPPADP